MFSKYERSCLCIAYKGQLYNGRSADLVTSRGALRYDITAYEHGIVSRGVLIDIPRLRGVKLLEPGEAVTREEIEAAQEAQGVRLGRGDVMLFRTGHHRRRLELGASYRHFLTFTVSRLTSERPIVTIFIILERSSFMN